MATSTIVTGDRYLEHLVRFVDRNAGALLDGTLTLKLNPVGLHYVQSRLEALQELEGLLALAPVDYLRAYVSDLGDHRALEQLRRILRLLTSLKVISVLAPDLRDPTPLSLLPFGRLRSLELKGCDLSTSAARGLLELRGTLEKLICHNSTDALRHVFASRIVDIKDSPVWNKLSLVSCACNGLVLMDESLQLLPVVETLDLSRNQFAKVANLRKCTKLQVLDLGYNHLRSIASLGEVSSRIVKLVLRNNALSTLHGIENLKSVEGLDLSYNIISSFTELEIVASLPCLHSLWLEGNPLCCGRWYRAHVFSFFSHPEELTVDDNHISTKEFWERHIILASRQKQPVGYGFYFPAKDDSEDDSTSDVKRSKFYRRLASIDDEEQRHLCSEAVEQESVSCDSDIQGKDDNGIPENESEITDLMNKIEYMKKERSVLWLREFKEWMDQAYDYSAERSQYRPYNLDPGRVNYTEEREGEGLLGESSGFVPVQIQASEVDSSLNVSHSNRSFDTNGIFGLEDLMANGNGAKETYLEIERVDTGQELAGDHSSDQAGDHSRGLQNLSPIEVKSVSSAPLTAIDEIISSRPSSVYPGSPPHYQEDILQRRLYLEEEFLQLSVESQSLASSGSDSDTSCSEDDSCRLSASVTELDHLLLQKSIELDITDKSTELSHKGNHHNGRHEEISPFKSCYGSDFNMGNCLLPNHDQQFSSQNSLGDACSCFTDQSLHRYDSAMDNQKGKQKLRRGFVSLSENSLLCDTGPEFQKDNGVLEGSKDGEGDREVQQNCSEIFVNDFCEGFTRTRFYDSEVNETPAEPMTCHPEQFILDFFHLKVADVRSSETCQNVVRCECIYQLHSVYHKSEVALLRSCKHKLYLLLIDVLACGQGYFAETISEVLGCYKLEELREVVVGLGLQALRVYMEGDATYLFLPRTTEKARDLLSLLRADDSTASSTVCSLRSWEQVQVNLLEKYICRSKMSIVLYSMLHFWRDNGGGDSWVLRSLFVLEGCLLVCMENLVHFSCLTDGSESIPPYYFLDSCCPIQNILEMVIQLSNDRCLTLTINNVSSDKNDQTRKQEDSNTRILTWKLKLFSEETLLKFVAVLKAIHLGLTASTLPVKCLS